MGIWSGIEINLYYGKKEYDLQLLMHPLLIHVTGEVFQKYWETTDHMPPTNPAQLI